MDTHIQFAHDLRGRPLRDDDEITDALRDDAPAWLHLSADHPDTEEWVATHLAWLEAPIRNALVEAETRPRASRIGRGLLVILRGINFNKGADPEDMVSLRIYVDPSCIVSLSRRRLTSVDALIERVRSGDGPESAGGLLADLVDLITDRIERQVADLEHRADSLEADVIADPRGELGPEVADQRLELTELRQYLPAQRDALAHLEQFSPDWLESSVQQRIAEQHYQMTRVVEALDAVREQLHTIRDEVIAARDERTNRNLYVLSVISAIFLPLGFLTGLMGINIAGMPGVDWPPAFWVFSIFLVVVTAVALVALKRLKIV